MICLMIVGVERYGHLPLHLYNYMSLLVFSKHEISITISTLG